MKKIRLIMPLLLVLLMAFSIASCAGQNAAPVNAPPTLGDSSVSDDTPLEDEDGLTIYEDQTPLNDFSGVPESGAPVISDSFPSDYSGSEEKDFSVKTESDVKTVSGTIKYDEIEKIFETVNKQRRDNGLSELKYDVSLQAGALQRSAEITVLWSHTRPDGTKWKTAAADCNGENIAYGYKNADAVMTGWMNSEGHRDNILKSDFTRIGIGAVEVGGLMYWVQLFGF